MVFNGLDFVVFLAVVLAVWAAIPRSSWRTAKGFLVLASYAFYMAWNPFFGLLLFGTTLADFLVARRLDRENRPGWRRALLAFGVVANLGVLGFFKYGYFLAASGRALLGLQPLPPDSFVANIVLPVGISF